MTKPFYLYEDISFQEFVLFIKTYRKQMEENINIYLNLDPSTSISDRKATNELLHSFLQFLTHSNVERMDEEYASHLDIWLQSQLLIINTKSFNLFQLIFEKSLITLMNRIKHNRMDILLLFLLTIFTYLVHSFNQWGDKDTTDLNKESLTDRDAEGIQSLDKLSRLLIRSSGVEDLPYILKKFEAYFHYKRCVFYAYVPWSNQFYGVIGAELSKVQSMKGQLAEHTTVFNSKKTIYLKNPKNYVKEEYIKLFNLSSVIFIPITYKDQLFGWLTLDQLGEEFECSKGELGLLEHVGKLFGLFLSRKGEKISNALDFHLTERESTILGLLAEGHDNKRIGELLFLSEHTVRDYVSSLLTKLKAKNRTQVVASAFRLGLLK